MGYDTIRYDTRCYFNVRSKANMSQLNLPHGCNPEPFFPIAEFGTEDSLISRSRDPARITESRREHGIYRCKAGKVCFVSYLVYCI